MKPVQRILLVVTALLSVILAFLGLAYFGAKSEGPISRMLTVVGTAVSEIEAAMTELVRGPGREAHLQWFQPYRQHDSLLRNPDVVLLGAYDNLMPQSLDGVVKLEQAIGTTFPLIHFYTAWGDKPEQRFPTRLVRAIWNLGSIPVITWEPWLVDFESYRHPHLPLRTERDKGGLAAIAKGMYDFYIDQWAADAAEFGKPLFVRFAHEMNDPYRYPWGPPNNSVQDFLDAWRYVVTRFRQLGATNVIWVWSPHVAYDYYPYYPGDEYVDWVATMALNFGTVAHWSRWWTFKEIFGDKYIYLAALNKPIMIAEMSSLAMGGDREEWFREALEDFPTKYPAVRSVLFFHNSSDATVTYQKLDWSFAGDSAVARVVSRSIAPWAPRNR